jgi:hypothetical protein
MQNIMSTKLGDVMNLARKKSEKKSKSPGFLRGLDWNRSRRSIIRHGSGSDPGKMPGGRHAGLQ